MMIYKFFGSGERMRERERERFYVLFHLNRDWIKEYGVYYWCVGLLCAKFNFLHSTYTVETQ